MALTDWNRSMIQNIKGIELNEQNNEELLPGYSEEFPYIATCAQLNHYRNPDVPWHWHRQVELFYMKSGSLEYTTPHGTWLFTEGMGGMVNSNVLHRSRPVSMKNENIQLLHIFDPALLSGGHGNRMERDYILPLVTDQSTEVILLRPEETEEKEIINRLRDAFELSEGQWGYEFALRESLTQIWLRLLKLVQPNQQGKEIRTMADEKIKQMMIYIHEHYRESISVEQLAESAYVSKRGCFRLFQENLHMSPVEYMRNYRLQRACQMLADQRKSITEIAQECGFGTSSYFGRLFRKERGCTPEQYRGKLRQIEPDTAWRQQAT